jgi:hypothetical protein
MTNFILALQTLAKNSLQVDNKVSLMNSVFMWIAIFELVLILLLVFKLKSKKNKLALSELERDTVKSAKSTKIDMDGLMNSINSSRGLYKELSRKCHPDKFMNDPKQKKAEEIFQEISRHERNFEKLNLLKTKAINELNITF